MDFIANSVSKILTDFKNDPTIKKKQKEYNKGVENRKIREDAVRVRKKNSSLIVNNEPDPVITDLLRDLD